MRYSLFVEWNYESKQKAPKLIKSFWKSSGSMSLIKNAYPQLGVVAHAFNPSTWEVEAGGFLSLRPEMAQRVRAPTALPKILSSNPNNHMVAYSHP